MALEVHRFGRQAAQVERAFDGLPQIVGEEDEDCPMYVTLPRSQGLYGTEQGGSTGGIEAECYADRDGECE